MSPFNSLDHQVAPPVDLADRRIPAVRQRTRRFITKSSDVHLVPAEVLRLHLGLEGAELAVELLPDELVVDRHGACAFERCSLLIERSVTTPNARPPRLTTTLLALQALETRLTCSSSYYDAQRWRAARRALECGRAMRATAVYEFASRRNSAPSSDIAPQMVWNSDGAVTPRLAIQAA